MKLNKLDNAKHTVFLLYKYCFHYYKIRNIVEYIKYINILKHRMTYPDITKP